MKKFSREEICQYCSLLYRAEKYELMIEYSKQLIEESPDLTPREEDIFYVGFRYKIAKELKSYSKLVEIERREKNKKKARAVYIIEIMNPIKQVIIKTAEEFDKLIDILITKAKMYGDMVKYMRWKLDFIRYKTQCLDRPEDKDLKTKEINRFDETYNNADILVKNFLQADDPISLELILSKAIHMYEILDEPSAAIKLALSCMETIKNSKNKRQMSKIYNTLRDNYVIWSKKAHEDVHL